MFVSYFLLYNCICLERKRSSGFVRDVHLSAVKPSCNRCWTESFGMLVSTFFLCALCFADEQSECVLQLQDIRSTPSQEIVQPVLATIPCPVRGFQVIISYPANIFEEDLEVSIENTSLSALNPELVIIRQLSVPDVDFRALFIVVNIDHEPPFDGRTLPPSHDFPLFYLHYSSPADIKSKIPIEFSNDIGDPPYCNTFTDRLFTSLPTRLIHGSFEVITETTEKSFLRGDVNGDKNINIADVIFLLSYLFANGFDPYPCMDTGDVNDGGTVDIADAVHILSFLFAEGAPPAYPFPTRGFDPTDDALQ